MVTWYSTSLLIHFSCFVLGMVPYSCSYNCLYKQLKWLVHVRKICSVFCCGRTNLARRDTNHLDQIDIVWIRQNRRSGSIGENLRYVCLDRIKTLSNLIWRKSAKNIKAARKESYYLQAGYLQVFTSI